MLLILKKPFRKNGHEKFLLDCNTKTKLTRLAFHLKLKVFVFVNQNDQTKKFQY